MKIQKGTIGYRAAILKTLTADEKQEYDNLQKEIIGMSKPENMKKGYMTAGGRYLTASEAYKYLTDREHEIEQIAEKRYEEMI